MAVRVAINGFGRIGRNVLRAIIESGRKDIEVVAINDLGPVETNAHLLRYDSVHGRFPGTITTGEDWIDIGQGKIKVTAIRNPAELPHAELNVDIAFECTGLFTTKEKASAHLTAGAKRVLVSAPADIVEPAIAASVVVRVAEGNASKFVRDGETWYAKSRTVEGDIQVVRVVFATLTAIRRGAWNGTQQR